jgi:hypothetical protein
MKTNSKLTLQLYWQQAKKYRLLIIMNVVFGITWSFGGMIIPIYYKKFF